LGKTAPVRPAQPGRITDAAGVVNAQHTKWSVLRHPSAVFMKHVAGVSAVSAIRQWCNAKDPRMSLIPY
jgi:hypothetical protein